MSVGSPVSGSTLEKAAQGAGATYLGQVNNWRDPVTNSKTAGASALALTVAGAEVGAWYGMQTGSSLGAPTGPIGMFAAGLIGGAVAGGGALIYGLTSYHPFVEYFSQPLLQKQVLDWQKNKSPITAPQK